MVLLRLLGGNSGAGQLTSRDHVDDEIGLIYDEIDEIYRYVRQGGEPPTLRSDVSSRRPSLPEQSSTSATAAAADYTWEEPIYEDIEKIRQRKRQRATMMTTTTTTDTTTTTTTTTTTAADDQQKQPSNNNNNNNNNVDVDVLPIGNLRQLIRRFSMLESTTSSKPAEKAAAKRERAQPPPVPPKLTVDAAISALPSSPPPAPASAAAAAAAAAPVGQSRTEDTDHVDSAAAPSQSAVRDEVISQSEWP